MSDVKQNIAVIDYGAGNINSVVNAFTVLGAHVFIASSPQQLSGADRIVMPGVGAFGRGIAHLKEGGWIPPLEREVLDKKKPFIGICLGMQLLAGRSFELGEHEGLNWIKGSVERLGEHGLRIPHIGWNDVRFKSAQDLFDSFEGPKDFYFVHSYVFKPEDPDIVIATCNYGEEFTAAIQKDNIFAVQFHPEKSHKFGLKVLENFLKIKSKCAC